MINHTEIKWDLSHTEIKWNLNGKEVPMPIASHGVYTEEGYKGKIQQDEIDAVYMMKFDLQRLRYHGILSDRQHRKAMKNLKKQAAKLGIYFA